MKDKRGAIQELLPVIIALVGIGITLAVAFLILAEIAANSTVAADTNASAAIDEVQSAMDDIPGWFEYDIYHISIDRLSSLP